jgi:hypothetical protein
MRFGDIIAPIDTTTPQYRAMRLARDAAAAPSNLPPYPAPDLANLARLSHGHRSPDNARVIYR